MVTQRIGFAVGRRRESRGNHRNQGVAFQPHHRGGIVGDNLAQGFEQATVAIGRREAGRHIEGDVHHRVELIHAM